MSIKSFFGAIVGGLQRVLGFTNKAAKLLADISVKALPIVEYIATITPGKTDDELIALYRIWALPNIQHYLALPAEERGAALLNAATKQLAKQFPNAKITEIQAAIQMALVAFKEKQAAAAGQ